MEPDDDDETDTPIFVEEESDPMPNAPPSFSGIRRQQAQARTMQPRTSASKRGYGKAWQAYSRAYLAENPICVGVLIKGKRVHAGGCNGLSACTDHIQAITGPD